MFFTRADSIRSRQCTHRQFEMLRIEQFVHAEAVERVDRRWFITPHNVCVDGIEVGRRVSDKYDVNLLSLRYIAGLRQSGSSTGTFP